MKRKTKKKVISGILIISILATCMMSNVFAANSETVEGGTILRELYESKKEVEAVNAVPTAKQIKEDEAATRSLYLDDVMAVNSEYSKYYGGSYLDDGELVVLLTDTSTPMKSFVKNTIESTPRFEKCDVSLQELKAIKEVILNYWENYVEGTNKELNEMVDSIVSVGTYVDQNKVYVHIVDCDEDKIRLFKENVICSENVFTANCDKVYDSSVQLKAGAAISSSGGGTRSIGFRGKRLKSNGSYEKGFVTAAHKLNINESILYAGTTIGYVSALKFTNNGKTDAAFVCLSRTDYECINKMQISGLTYSSYTRNVTTGMTVSKEGQTTGWTSGVIRSTDEEIATRNNGVKTTIKDLYLANYTSDLGDSGGIVYKTTSIGYLVVGIHKATGMENGEYMSYIVKVKNILDELNITMY